jgi:hypothetical protein
MRCLAYALRIRSTSKTNSQLLERRELANFRRSLCPRPKASFKLDVIEALAPALIWLDWCCAQAHSSLARAVRAQRVTYQCCSRPLSRASSRASWATWLGCRPCTDLELLFHSLALTACDRRLAFEEVESTHTHAHICVWAAAEQSFEF